MRIVAADDDEGMARVLDRTLRSWGYDAVIVRDGNEAWRVLKRDDTPRVAILDWDMPGLTGLEVCRLLRSTPHGASVYVLMLTARQDTSDVIAALESGADDFLAKPFHVRELQLRLAKGVRDSTRIRAAEKAADKDKGGRISSVPPAGTTLGDKYRLERVIAKGGMGTVWAGIHLSLGVNVAVKFMDPELASTADYASFEREARAAAQLRNEHTVRVYDHGISADGLPYLVMEYLGGESLAARIDRLGALPLDAVAALVEQAARALGEAHARGIVHRDVKPENILLLEDPERSCGFCVKLIDFGLANAEAWSLRQPSGLLAGTVHYMSPEYLSGDAAPNSLLDLWGLAVTAFVAATGRLPFDGEGVSEVYRRISIAPLPIPSQIGVITTRVSPAFDRWFARACSRDPSERFPTALDLATALSAACKTELED